MTSLLMTADTVGGVWTYALELVEALAPAGVEVSLATMGASLTGQQRRELAGSSVAAVHESSFALEWMHDPWREVEQAGEWLLGLEQRAAPDVVHLNGYVHAALPWRAPAVVVAHSCVLSWWQAVHGRPAPAEWDQYRRRVGAGLAAADAVVAPTAAMADALDCNYAVAGVTVVANCRRADWVREVAKQPLIISAGRLWDEAKNLTLVERVAPRLRWPVVLAGEARRPVAGPAPRTVDHVVRTIPPTGDWSAGTGMATLLGPLPFVELAQWLMRAAVFVLPARYEPFGLAALEAGLAGCALVLGDIPSLRQLWGDAALFVDPDDEQGLVDAVGALTDDAVLLRDMSRRARDRAREYSPERCARGYLALYQALPLAAGDPA